MFAVFPDYFCGSCYLRHTENSQMDILFSLYFFYHCDVPGVCKKKYKFHQKCQIGLNCSSKWVDSNESTHPILIQILSSVFSDLYGRSLQKQAFVLAELCQDVWCEERSVNFSIWSAFCWKMDTAIQECQCRNPLSRLCHNRHQNTWPEWTKCGYSVRLWWSRK